MIRECIVDNHTGEQLDTYDYTERLCEILNKQQEENIQLQKTINKLDNLQKAQSHRINDLYLENKQLKELITQKGYTIKYDGYRHISLELKKKTEKQLYEAKKDK